MMKKEDQHIETWTEEKVKRRTFFAFAAYAALGATGFMSWRWFKNLPTSDNGLSTPSRKVLNFNERLNDGFFSEQRLAPTFPRSQAANPARANGDIGINENIEQNAWRLEFVHPVTGISTYAALQDVKSLPKEDIVFDFKCIEGWNEIVHYTGVKLSDLMAKFNLGKKENGRDWYRYVGLETPDGEYYVGLDMKSALHPQTLLCFESNGAPLTVKHGAPLRLIIPVKYGVKNLKCIGKLTLSDTPPKDYWHENGYEYDAAL